MTGIPEPLCSQARKWAELWGVPDLADSVTVEFSPRFRSSLGRCRPVEGRIRLAAHLANGRRDLLEEVFCHELAHVAVHRLHGPKARPHGPEWKGLVSAAGFEPRVRFPPGEGGFPPRPPRRRARYEHRCPVCQAMRMAGRPVRNWRCVECLRAGLSGKLVITRIPVGVGGGGGGGGGANDAPAVGQRSGDGGEEG
jgi:predicted SprT family Zn-dependent metalloprotease